MMCNCLPRFHLMSLPMSAAPRPLGEQHSAPPRPHHPATPPHRAPPRPARTTPPAPACRESQSHHRGTSTSKRPGLQPLRPKRCQDRQAASLRINPAHSDGSRLWRRWRRGGGESWRTRIRLWNSRSRIERREQLSKVHTPNQTRNKFT